MRVSRIPLILVLGLFLSKEVRAQVSYADIAGRAIIPTELTHVNPITRDTVTTVLDLPAAQTEVVLVAQGDTLRERTNLAGSFSFKKLPVGPVHMSISFGNYEPFSETFELVPGENVVIVALRRKTETLDAAVVKAKQPVVTQRGDTLVYHAAAVALQTGDYAIDLLKQFPGVEVKDGQITVTGKQVRRSYVNGALIFGLDPMASMEYLKADQVTTMDVYDEANPQDRMDGVIREKERVINIKTKDPIFNTMDLQVRLLAGADQQPADDGTPQVRYTAGTNAHFFSELKQLSADFVTGNLGMFSSNINMTPGPQSTYLQNTDLKLGYNRFWESPLFGDALKTAYTFADRRTRNRNRRLQEYFEAGDIPERTSENSTSSGQRIRTHGLSTDYTYRTGKKVTLGWQQSLQLSRDETDREIRELLTVAGGTPMLRDETSRADRRSWTLNETLNFSFIKPGKRLPAITLSARVGKDNLDEWNLDTLASSYSKRYLTKDGAGLSQEYRAELRQSLFNSLKEQKILQVNGVYRFGYTNQKKQQEAYDLYGSPTPLPNLANTFDYTFSSLRNALQLQVTYAGGQRFRVMGTLTAEAERVLDAERFPVAEPGTKTFYRLLPTLLIGLKNINISLNSMARTPAVEQLRRRIDDTHPLSLQAGNPALKQSRSFSLSVGKNSISKPSNHILTWSLQGQWEVHPIVQKTTFFSQDTILDDYDGYQAKAGSSLMRAENADHGWNANANMMVSSQWGGKWKVSTQFIPLLTYRSTPQYFGQTLERTSEFSPSLQASGSMFPTKDLMIGFNGNLAYIRALNQSGSLNQNALQGTLGLRTNWDFLRYAFFNGSYEWRSFRDMTTPEMSSDIHRLNLSLGVNLLKKRLKISLSGIDLLRGGSQYTVTVGPSSLTRTWTPVYGRYFLIDISYRFNNSSGNQMTNFSR